MSKSTEQVLADADRAIQNAREFLAKAPELPSPQALRLVGLFALIGMWTVAAAVVAAIGGGTLLVWTVCKAMFG